MGYPYELHEEFNSIAYTPGALADAVWHRGAREVDSITIHHWGNLGQDFWTVNKFLCTNGSTSAHEVIQDGLVSTIVDGFNCAWHCSNPEGNTNSIGLELRPEATEGDYRTAAERIAHYRSIYGDLPLKRHSDWFNTACPGKWDLVKLDRYAREAAGQVAAPAPVVEAPKPAPAPAPAPAPVSGGNGSGPGFCYVEAGDTLSEIAAQYGKTVQRLVDLNPGIDADVIYPGQKVFLLNHCFVDAGDTLLSIAAQFGYSLQHVINCNPGIDPNNIKPGQVIYFE